MMTGVLRRKILKSSLQSFLLTLGIICVTLTNGIVEAHDNTLKIGVISPKGDGSAVLAGESHEESIRLAFTHLPPLQVGNLHIKLDLIPWNDNGLPEKAVQGALHLTHEDHVVALLGPVNSGSTKETLKILREQQLELPVISALSTAPELTDSGLRDKNFFRLIFDDADRMGQYATFIKQEKAKEGEQHFLFLYQDNPYGEGLKNSLKNRFYTPNITDLSWRAILQSNCSHQGTAYLTDIDAMRSGECFTEAFKQLLQQSSIDSIVLLGDTPGSLSLVNGLNASTLGSNIDYFFVGSNKRLFDEAPAGSITIGDPVLDPARAPTTGLGSDWGKLLDEFEDRAKKDRADFVMTAYEAAMVLHSALRIVLSGQESLPDIHEVRKSLLQVLESETFDSLEPWRSISFSQGKLDQIPTAPIYRITRGVAREDTLKTHPWIQLSAQSVHPWLETPVEVQLDAHAIESARLGLFSIDEATNHEFLIEDRWVTFSAGQAIERFHLLPRGLYNFKVLDAPFAPARTQTRVDLSNHYFISAIAAAVGAILAVSRAPFTVLSWMIRVLTGIMTGLLLTFCSFYGQQLSGWIPIPSFGTEPIVNAMLTGLIGGLIGPHLLADLLVGWSRRLVLPSKTE
ncbi:amino acid ABC transporter substrate-binding protein [Nitrosomonas sp. JL21]|nr:amino acid ABC transporter substrate-binding protein [Nitrosomonas sp. JL21]